MNRFSKTQIYLHWITLLFVAITYAAMELRGWFPKGSSTYLLMRETHYNAGIFVWVLMFSRLGNDSNLLIVFYVQIMPDDFVMQLHRF